MTWLYTALYEGKYIDKDSSSDLWDLKSTEISFLGTTYETKDKINIDEMAYVPLSSIHIDTKTKKSGKLARVIEFDLPQQTLDQNAGKIRSYFAGNDITWENTSDGKTLCISFDANNFSDLAQKTRTVLHSKNSFGTYSSTCSKDNPFTLKINYEESLDLSHFIHLMKNRCLVIRSNKKKSALLLLLHSQFQLMRLLRYGTHPKISVVKCLFLLKRL